MFKLFSLLFVAIILMLSMLALPLGAALAQDGDILFTKTADKTDAGIGETVTYTYLIVNNSTDNITGLILDDDKIGPIALSIAELAASDNYSVNAGYTITAGDYADNATEIVNVAILTYSTGSDNTTITENITATETVTLNAYEAALEVTKDADRDDAGLGEIITYNYSVKNTGDLTISDIVLNDDMLGAITLTDTTLDPGESASGTDNYTVTLADVIRGTVTNVATASGFDPSDDEVTASTTEVVFTNALAELFKSQILKARGVPGKGIDTAPGLQKPFNPNSRAAENAGKKDGKGNLESNNNLELNQGNTENREKNRERELNIPWLFQQEDEPAEDDSDDDEVNDRGNGKANKKLPKNRN